MDSRYDWKKWIEGYWMWIAWHLPTVLVMLCAVRVHAQATQGKWSGQIVPELTAMDSVKRWMNE